MKHISIRYIGNIVKISIRIYGIIDQLNIEISIFFSYLNLLLEIFLTITYELSIYFIIHISFSNYIFKIYRIVKISLIWIEVTEKNIIF